MSDAFTGAVPAMPFIKLDDGGTPFLAGVRCTGCGMVLVGAPRACTACGCRSLTSQSLSRRGRLHTWTIVFRSFPGVGTPFVAAVVDLDGGGTLKGTLIDVAPEPSHLQFDLPVEVIFRDSGQRDEHGKPFITHAFSPIVESRS